VRSEVVLRRLPGTSEGPPQGPPGRRSGRRGDLRDLRDLRGPPGTSGEGTSGGPPGRRGMARGGLWRGSEAQGEGSPLALTRRQGASEALFQMRDKLCVTNRSTAECAALQFANSNQFFRFCKETGPALAPSGVGVEVPIEPLGPSLSPQMSGCAGPLVLFWSRYQIRPNRIPLDVAQGYPKMS
jgi:hypothetical protein